MKKNKFNITSLATLLFVALFSFALTACHDDDNGGGQPEITGVKILSSDTINYNYDQYYEKAGAGTMLAIMGNNLSGVVKVYINDQEVSFNSTMNTDHNLIVTVPTEENGFKLSAFDSSIPDEIRVETTHGTAVYSFKITAPGPQLQRIQAVYPRQAGDELLLHGLNLVDIKKIYVTDVMAAQLDTTTWTEVPGNKVEFKTYKDVKQDHQLNSETKSYQTTSIVSATMPEAVPDSGALVVECAAGTTYVPYYRVPGKPAIFSCSNDMPQIGETLVLTGRDFVQVESVELGDVKLTSDEFTVSESEDSIYIPFTRKPSEGAATVLKVTTPGGVATSDRFYDRSTILTTFDFDEAIDNGWTPNAEYIDGGNEDGRFAQIKYTDYGSNWWGIMVFFRKDWSGNKFSFSDNIPATATADELYLAYNVYDNNSCYGNFGGKNTTAMLKYDIFPDGDSFVTWPNQGDGFGWGTEEGAGYAEGVIVYDHPVLGDVNDKAYKQKWYRAVVSLNNFSCYKGMNFAAIKATGLNQFRIQAYNPNSFGGDVDIKLDNIRIIYIPKK